jgi:glycosyltransferase involved in cell wall biosynthesis
MNATSSTATLLSIVIPTKNRYETLFPTLAAILSNIKDPRLEVVIQDNSDDPTTAQAYLKAHPDPRIRYAHLAGAVSIVENTEAALALANGEYLTFIGDDDFVSPYILEFVQSFSERSIEAVMYPPAYYWWKSVNFAVLSRFHQPGAFWYPLKTSRDERIISAAQELARVVEQGAVSLFDLPRLYHGIVHRSVLSKIKAKTGRIVNGASPDMALAVAISVVIDTYLKVDKPLTVFGSSRNSGGGWTASKTHFGRISDQPHLPQWTKDKWNENLPSIWCEHTIYAQSASEVLTAFGKTNSLNYLAFYASMMVNDPQLRGYVSPFVAGFLRRHPQKVFRFFAIAIKKLLGRFKRAFQTYVSGLPFDLHFFDSPDACMKHIRNAHPTSR